MKNLLISLVMILGCAGCTSTNQRTFTQTQSPSWTSVELREGIDADRAWHTVFELLMKDFDIEAAWPEQGYLRTAWLHSWSGQYQFNYRVRVTLKFSQDRKSLSYRTQAQSLYGNVWIDGSDARLVNTLKTDLMGTLGRTTR